MHTNAVGFEVLLFGGQMTRGKFFLGGLGTRKKLWF